MGTDDAVNITGPLTLPGPASVTQESESTARPNSLWSWIVIGFVLAVNAVFWLYPNLPFAPLRVRSDTDLLTIWLACAAIILASVALVLTVAHQAGFAKLSRSRVVMVGIAVLVVCIPLAVSVQSRLPEDWAAGARSELDRMEKTVQGLHRTGKAESVSQCSPDLLGLSTDYAYVTRHYAVPDDEAAAELLTAVDRYVTRHAYEDRSSVNFGIADRFLENRNTQIYATAQEGRIEISIEQRQCPWPFG